MSRFNEDLDYLITNLDITEEELEEIIIDSDNLILEADTENDKRIEAYLKKAQCLQKLDKFFESEEIINQLLLLNPDMPEALVRLGYFYYNNNEYDKANYYITKAIENKTDYAYAYYNRGLIKYKLFDNNGAIEDFTKTIEIKPDYSSAYNCRGLAKYRLPDYDSSIEDYSKAIEIKPYYSSAYQNRGSSKYMQRNYISAIEDYSKAIEIRPDFSLAYYNRGLAYILIGDNQKAAKNFVQAETDILSILIIIEKHILDENVIIFMLDDDEFFKKETEKEEQKEKINDYKNIFIQSLKIISKLHVKEKDEMPVSHYTSKDISEKLLFDKYKNNKIEERSYFRLNSVNTSNDPEEGRTLYHYIFPQEKMSSEVEEFGAFAGCFIFNNDSLNQFRLYGKTEDKEEGTGVSISLNDNFFSEKINTSAIILSESNNKEEESTPYFLPLFRCIYIDPETNKTVSLGQKEEYVFYRENKNKKDYQKYKSNIDKTQNEISEGLEKLKKQIEKSDLNHDIVYKLLLNLRYLVKHVAFKEEQECRIVQIRRLDDKMVKSNEKDCLYIDYMKMDKDNVSEICFAPKANDIDKFKQHLARNNYKIKCYKSTAPWV